MLFDIIHLWLKRLAQKPEEEMNVNHIHGKVNKETEDGFTVLISLIVQVCRYHLQFRCTGKKKVKLSLCLTN
jgi:hypothetical protein